MNTLHDRDEGQERVVYCTACDSLWVDVELVAETGCMVYHCRQCGFSRAEVVDEADGDKGVGVEV